MSTMLGHITQARTYVDETFVFIVCFEQQLSTLAQVFAQVHEYGLLLQPSKCNLCV